MACHPTSTVNAQQQTNEQINITVGTAHIGQSFISSIGVLLKSLMTMTLFMTKTHYRLHCLTSVKSHVH